MVKFENEAVACLEVQDNFHDFGVKKKLFVKSAWEPSASSPTSFSLACSDGHQAWTFEGSEAFVKERADTWDKNVCWVMEKLRFYLSVGQPGAVYHFKKTRDNQIKLSFEIQDKDTNLPLTASFLMLTAAPEIVTSDMFSFLLHGNEKLTVAYLEKCQSFDQNEAERKALLKEVEHLKNEMFLFQKNIFPKFDLVVNSKKAKLRELREKLKRIEEANPQENMENDATSSSSDDDENDQPSLPKKWTKRGGDAVLSEDLNKTRPCLDHLGSEYQKQDGSRNAPAALGGDSPYTGLKRKRRRN